MTSSTSPLRSVAARSLRLLATPAFDRAVIALAVLLVLPCVPLGFAADDAMLRVRAGADLGFGGLPPSRWDLFVFVRDDPAQRQALLESGMLSWWTAPHYRIGFLRPLSSITHALDFAAWPSSPAAMYVHSIVHFVLMLVAARAVFRRLLPATTAGLALALFALDDARGPVVGYISNRNALLMATLGFVALWAHDSWRRGGWRAGAIVGPAAFAAGLLAGEGTVATAGYLFAHACLLERGPALRRPVVLWPYLAVGIAWTVLYEFAGYGTYGSDIYIDPGRETLAFLEVLPGRMLALLGAQWFGPWSDFWLAYPGWLALVVGSFAALVIAATLLALRRHGREAVGAWVFASGAVFACVPIAGTFPADRLLGFVGLGGAATLALVLMPAIAWIAAGTPMRWPTRLAVGALVAVHLVLAPLLLPVRSRSMVTVREALATLDVTVPRDGSIVGREVMVVFAPNDGPASYLAVTRVSAGVPAPTAARVLATSTGSVSIRRADRRTLVIDARDGLLTTPIERMFRSTRVPFAVGERALLGGGGQVEVVAITDDARPARLRVTLPLDLDDPHYVWRAWTRDGFVPWRPPAVGEQVALEGFDLAHAVAVAMGLAGARDRQGAR